MTMLIFGIDAFMDFYEKSTKELNQTPMSNDAFGH